MFSVSRLGAGVNVANKNICCQYILNIISKEQAHILPVYLGYYEYKKIKTEITYLCNTFGTRHTDLTQLSFSGDGSLGHLHSMNAAHTIIWC